MTFHTWIIRFAEKKGRYHHSDYDIARAISISMRTLIGTGLILFLMVVIYANAVGNATRQAHSQAAIRLIDEALDNGDIEAVRHAINEYNRRGKSPSVIVEVLANRQRHRPSP